MRSVLRQRVGVAAMTINTAKLHCRIFVHRLDAAVTREATLAFTIGVCLGLAKQINLLRVQRRDKKENAEQVLHTRHIERDRVVVWSLFKVCYDSVHGTTIILSAVTTLLVGMPGTFVPLDRTSALST
ncbi:MAG: hypothetical protein C4326_08740 [Ignavibacteria bacterium]